MASGGGTGNGKGSGLGPASSLGGGSALEPVQLVHHDCIRIGPLTVDPPACRIAHDDGHEAILEPRTMQVLVALLRADGRILSRDDLIQACWQGRIVGDEAISSVLYRLRRTVKDIAEGVFQIETITKVGFRLVRHAPAANPGAAVPAAQRRIDFGHSRNARWGAAAAAIVGSVSLAFFAGSDSHRIPPPAQSTERAPSLAVLPFADLSPGRDNEYFSEGMAEAIMGLLSEEPGLHVIGRTSIAMLGRGADIEEARTRLGVTHVLEGSVRKSGQALRVNVRLIDARDGRQIWAEEFDRSLGDIFAVQDDIGAKVLSRLRGTLAASRDRPGSVRTSLEVYDLYLAAKSLEREETLPAFLRAKALLRRAIRLDPEYAPAHARLASYARKTWIPGRPSADDREWAASLDHARRALRLAPNLGDAHAAMGMLLENEKDWARSIPYLQSAVELDPGNFLAWNMLGHVQQMHLCRYREAAASYRRAAAIEPLIASPRYSLAFILAEMGEFADAAASTRRFVTVSKDPVHVPKFQAMISFYTGDLSAAANSVREAVKLDPNDWGVKLGHMQILRALGMIDEAVRFMPDFQRPIAVPLLRNDYETAAAAAMRTGDGIWSVAPGYLPLAMPALLRGGGDQWLLQSFDRKYPSVEDFDSRSGCRHAVFFGPHLIVAMRLRGRDRDGERMLRLTNAQFTAWAAAGHRGAMHRVLKARLLLLTGRTDAALAALDDAVTLGWLDQFWPFFSMSDTLFDPVRTDPRFRAVERRIQAGVRRERRELAGQAGRTGRKS